MIPDNLRYTKEHEWVLPEGDAWTVGITDFAQRQLGDVVFVELPKVGDLLTKGQEFGSIESVKAVSEMYAPVSGRVMAINEELEGEPEMINTDTYSDGWLIKIQPSDKDELKELMDASAYEKFTSEEQ